MASWSFLHIGAEILRTSTIEVPVSEHELAANQVLPTMWLSLFDPEDLEIIDVTDDAGAADLLDAGVIAEGDRDLEVFWITRRDLAHARAERLWQLVRDDPYFGVLWRPLELLMGALAEPTARPTVVLDPREFVGAVGLSDFLDPARELVSHFAAARARGLEALRGPLFALARDNPVLFALEFSGDLARDARLARDLVPLYRLESGGHVLAWCTIGWPVHDEALAPRWESWLDEVAPLGAPAPHGGRRDARSPVEFASAFLAFLEEHRLIEYRHSPRDLLARVAALLAGDRDGAAAPALYEVLMSHDAVDEVFCDADTLKKALAVWG